MARTKSAAVTNPGLAKVNKPVKAAVARRQGCPNYKRDLLVKIVGEILPVSYLDWFRVTRVYLRRSGELELREIAHIKRFWKHVCCYNNRVPTGDTGGHILVAQGIQNQILEKKFCEDCGVPEDFGDAADAEENVTDTEEEAGSGHGSTELAILAGVAKSLEKTAEDRNMMKMMQMMMMQQNSQQMMIMMMSQQMMITMMQLVTALLGRPSAPFASAILVASSSNSSCSSLTSACDFNV